MQVGGSVSYVHLLAWAYGSPLSFLGWNDAGRAWQRLASPTRRGAFVCAPHLGHGIRGLAGELIGRRARTEHSGRVPC